MYILKNLLLIISLGYGADYFQPELHSFSRDQNSFDIFNIPENSTLRLVGIMAQFPIESPDNPKTSGNGQFLSNTSESYINFFESEIPRCDGFIVDRPPHNASYFQAQLEAVGNYYNNVSNNKLSYTTEIIINPNSDENGYYTVSHDMEYYAKGDTLLARFYSEVLYLAKTDIEDYFDGKGFSPNEVVFIVFHAGLSQDFSYPSLDPTIYDLMSAYIDTIMMEDINPTQILQNGNSYDIKTGVLLPETQNMIYFDVVEDIFGNPDYDTDDLCDIQVGMTGIFAMLLGYELGLPPMFNTETGNPGVGYFGLMDHGSNNGRGVIPAPPNPWTRTFPDVSWLELDIINPVYGVINTIQIPALVIGDTVYRINIAEDEYFLIENRNNWVSPLVDIDSLRRKHKINENQLGHWFDSVIEEFTDSQIQIDENTGVITSFDHYDYGLPGSGILIWHIEEPDVGSYLSGINNDRYNRHVQIEEADGAVDIGFESYTFFSSDNPTAGTRWDMWFSGNEAYEFGNPYALEVVFDNGSNPNTQTTEGAESFLSITMLSEISDSMYIRIKMEEAIEIINLSDEPVQYLGNKYDSLNNIAAVFYEKEELIYKHSSNSIIDTMNYLDYVEGQLIYTYEELIEYFPENTCIHPLCVEDEIYPLGYFYSAINAITEPVPGALSFGDIDGDGLDEIITIENGDIFVKNNNGTHVNGFPVNGNFLGVPLIANILEGSKPEIICREGDDIVVISHRGEILLQLSSLDADQPLAMVPYWNGKMALIDGSRLLLFELDMDHSYWMNKWSRPSGFPLSTGNHIIVSMGNQNAYNYPNPITEGSTTFRFFIESGSSVEIIKIRIYDTAGFLVKDNLELRNGNITENEFNEIHWTNIQVDAGLYLAEIKQDTGKTELVRLVIIR